MQAHWQMLSAKLLPENLGRAEYISNRVTRGLITSLACKTFAVLPQDRSQLLTIQSSRSSGALLPRPLAGPSAVPFPLGSAWMPSRSVAAMSRVETYAAVVAILRG